MVTFLDFRLSQGSVATYCRLGGNLCDMFIENFSYKSPGERIMKIGPHLPKLLSNIKGLIFWNTVYIDEKLQWIEHINHISAKVSKNIGILKKISHLLSTSVLLQLYNTLVLPYLNYCNMIWTVASETLLNKLQV